MWTDPLLRALGADPQVFRPVYRVQKILLHRGVRLVRRRGRQTGSFGLVCLLAAVYGTAGLLFLYKTRLPVLGGGLALTCGCAYLLMVVLADHAEVLVLPRERLVLAAHPHDDRSLLLAKLVAVGRSLALLWACLFLPPCLIVAHWWGARGVLAFLAGAAGAAIAVATSCVLVAVLLVRSGGKRAMERVMPWLQTAFQLTFFVPTAANVFFRPEQLSGSVRDLMAWLLPTFWFTAPLEFAAGGAGAPAWGRLALAGGSLAALVVAGGRLATGLGRRLLEPEPRAAAGRSRRALPSDGVLGFLLRFEGLRLFSLLRVHLRSDWRTLSEVLSMPVTGLFFLFLYSRQGSGFGGVLRPFFFCWLLFLGADTLTRSQRPGSLWWLLSSPIDRTRFSLATISLLRLFLLVPLAAAVALLTLRQGLQPDASLAQSLWYLAALVAWGDLLLLLGKVAYPEFPFSRGREGGMAADRFAIVFVGALVSGAVTGALALCQPFGTPGFALAALAGVLLHLPASHWARRRTARAAARLDLVQLC